MPPFFSEQGHFYAFFVLPCAPIGATFSQISEKFFRFSGKNSACQNFRQAKILAKEDGAVFPHRLFFRPRPAFRGIFSVSGTRASGFRVACSPRTVRVVASPPPIFPQCACLIVAEQQKKPFSAKCPTVSGI